MKKNLLWVGIISLFRISLLAKADLTIMGPINFNDGISRQSIGLIDCLRSDLSINFIKTPGFVLKDITNEVKDILEKPFDKPGNCFIYQDLLHTFNKKIYSKINNNNIKFAYSMYEATLIPFDWVEKLNKYFDGVIVPDDFLIDVYKNSGVKIPIFVLPLGIYIDEFLSFKREKQNKRPCFVFGCTNRFYSRKNHKLLIDAFAREFKDEENVILRLSGGGQAKLNITYSQVLKQIAKLKRKNIILTNDALSWDKYRDLLSSFDCYINVSLAEGFSIVPREALALGIPSILSNNTAQTTICKSGYVYAVDSNIKVSAVNSAVNETVGDYFDCKVDDVQKAMREVYINYDLYLNKAKAGKEWVKQYRWPALKDKFLNVIKPKKVIFGDQNIVTDDYLMTDSELLYKKYVEILS